MRQHILLLDACIAINLVATDRFGEISERLNLTFNMVRQAAAEVGQLREEVDGDTVVTEIDLERFDPLTLAILDLAPAEYATYVELAAAVDDGEAATLAVAINRQILMATDDRKARRLCKERSLPEPVGSLSLLRRFTENASMGASEIAQLLGKVRRRASFLPPRLDPDREWWAGYLDL